MEKLFSNVEHKLKGVAKVNLVLGVISTFIMLLWGVYQYQNYSRYFDIDVATIVIYFVLVVAVFLVVLIMSWLLYAFAELVEHTKCANHSLKRGFMRVSQNDTDKEKDQEKWDALIRREREEAHRAEELRNKEVMK